MNHKEITIVTSNSAFNEFYPRIKTILLNNTASFLSMVLL